MTDYPGQRLPDLDDAALIAVLDAAESDVLTTSRDLARVATELVQIQSRRRLACAHAWRLGISYARLGELLGVSKEAAHQLVMRGLAESETPPAAVRSR